MNTEAGTPAPGYRVAVRALCEFSAKQGDLDLRFTPSPSAQDGIAGHATVGSRRGAGWQAEVALEGQYRQLRVRGRADGFDAARARVEEIKTFVGDLARMPDNHRQLHLAQARVYGHLLCEKLALAQIEVALVYFDIVRQKETVLCETMTAPALRQFFETLCARFLDWAEQELAHRAARDAALTTLAFPHPQFRPGQRQLAEAVYKANLGARCLLAQAPTGIGKTVGTLFPMLKAAATQQLDKVFYLAAKSSGRQLALDALALLGAGTPALPLRVLELVAREKACEHPELACHGQSCPLACGFYDRLPAARAEAVQGGLLGRATLRAIALRHEVCSYYLSQDLVRWADVVVGDYNYYFDVSALLHALTEQNQWRVSVLVDEAHNLLPRARAMYSAELDPQALRAARASAPAPLKKALNALQRSWNGLAAAQQAPYQVYPEVDEKLRFTLQQACAAILEQQSAEPLTIDADLQRFYFDMLHFTRMLDAFGEHSLFDVSKETQARGSARLCLRNLIPAPFLAPRLQACRAAVLFSATLSPFDFYADMLGLAGDTVWLDVDSPFDSAQLEVRIARTISTRWAHRDASLAPVAALMGAQFAAQRGNYLAFFSSYDYLQQVLAQFRLDYPDVPVWEQARRMDEAAQAQFLQRFSEDGCGIGFAVLGGAFAEGIDLPGRRLIGAFVATLGLPQVNPVNEEIMRRMKQVFGAERGYDYTYLYPGLQKVVQAAGRVIRTASDRGVVHLIDERFGRPAVRRLLPLWWHVPRE